MIVGSKQEVEYVHYNGSYCRVELDSSHVPHMKYPKYYWYKMEYVEDSEELEREYQNYGK